MTMRKPRTATRKPDSVEFMRVRPTGYPCNIDSIAEWVGGTVTARHVDGFIISIPDRDSIIADHGDVIVKEIDSNFYTMGLTRFCMMYSPTTVFDIGDDEEGNNDD